MKFPMYTFTKFSCIAIVLLAWTVALPFVLASKTERKNPRNRLRPYLRRAWHMKETDIDID